MSGSEKSAAAEVEVEDRLQPIHVASEYLGRYRSAVTIRDLPTLWLDEPVELGGENTGPTPMEGILASLTACTAMIVHILRRETGFRLEALRCEADGVVDVRRVEMQRTGKRYSEIEPIAPHFHSVSLRIRLRTAESEERLEELGRQVARLCPVSRLLADAGVALDVRWIRE
jgi:putative redox protein